MFGLNPMELIIVGAVAVLLFGSRLPSVARSLGKSMTEFKRGLHGVEEEVHSAGTRPSRVSYSPDDRDEPTAAKFEPPTSEPVASDGSAEKAVGA